MSRRAKCSECGTRESVKQAREYEEVARLLGHWLEAFGDTLLCPSCAVRVCGDLRGETVRVIPLNFHDGAKSV